jgi:hypothetical protein
MGSVAGKTGILGREVDMHRRKEARRRKVGGFAMDM